MQKKIIFFIITALTLLSPRMLADCYMEGCSCTHIQYAIGGFSGNTFSQRTCRERDRERNEHHYENKKRKHIRKANVDFDIQLIEYCSDCGHLIEEHDFDDDHN